MTSRKRPHLVPPPQVVMEREYTVHYTRSGCECSHCIKEKKILAAGFVDAATTFQKRYPLASVVRVTI